MHERAKGMVSTTEWKNVERSRTENVGHAGL